MTTPPSSALISVIIPIYNVEKFLTECLSSIAAQDDENFEAILVDDGSTDNSSRIAQEFCQQNTVFQLISQRNHGLGAARNTGIAAAKGEFITFVDSDDFLDSSAIRKLRIAQAKFNSDVVSGRFIKISESGEFISTQEAPKLQKSLSELSQAQRVLGVLEPSIACSRLYRASLLHKNHIRFPNRMPYEDLYFTYKVIRQAEKPVNINDKIYYWRQRQGSLSKSISTLHVDSIFEQWFDTSKYLKNTNSTEIDYALAARRTITLIDTLARQIDGGRPSAIAYFYNILNQENDLIRNLYQIVECSPLKSLYASKTAKRIITQNKSPLPIQLGNSPFIKFENSSKIEIDFTFFPLRAYHVRELSELSKELFNRGAHALVVTTDKWRNDFETTNEAGKLGINTIELTDFIQSRITVRCIVFFNDWDPVMRLIAKACTDHTVTSIGWIEGVQDYLDRDTGRIRHPYRRSQHVILPGAHDKKYFQNSTQTLHLGHVIRIQKLWNERKSYSISETGKALINSNFSYGVLESVRDDWIQKAVTACLASNLIPVISRHPFDLGKTHKKYESQKSFFELLYDCDVVIQRFASGILEALACRVPVIYFNPHGELVDKFKSPQGAYLLANDCAGLTEILTNNSFFWKESETKSFLNEHAGLPTEELDVRYLLSEIFCSINDQSTEVLIPNQCFTDLANLLTQPDLLRSQAHNIDLLFPNVFHSPRTKSVKGKPMLNSPSPQNSSSSTSDVESSQGFKFTREIHANIDETEAIAYMMKSAGIVGQMIDVGAHYGKIASHFDNLGWKIHCCEPDPENRARLVASLSGKPNITIDSRAVSDTSAQSITLFTSEESTGISSLHSFHKTHSEAGKVDVTTIAEIVDEQNIHHIDFLKIDVEGMDFAVLRGVPWDKLQPDVIEAEFEDTKTLKLGHTYIDMCEFLEKQGYAVYLSEWHPIIRYGIAHDWHQIVKYPVPLASKDAWGNILAFRKDPGIETLQTVFRACLKFNKPRKIDFNSVEHKKRSNNTKMQSFSNSIFSTPGLTPYASFAEWIKAKNLTLFRFGQFFMWVLRELRNNILFSSIGFVVFTALIVGPFTSNMIFKYAGFSWTLAAILGFIATTTLGVAFGNKMMRDFAERETSSRQALKAQFLGELKRSEQTTHSKLIKEIESLYNKHSLNINKGQSDIQKEIANILKNQRIEEERWQTTPIANYNNFQSFNRKLSREQIGKIINDWSEKLGIVTTPKSLSYLAHRIAMIDSNSYGRLATTIENAVLRVLIASAVKRQSLHILEIGTLFGIGLTMIHDHVRYRFDSVQFTAIDPLEGYYNKQSHDIITNEVISEDIFRRNLSIAAIPDSDITLIKALSTNTAALESVKQKQFDVLIIDGDHSYTGVKFDYENYGLLVRTGGFIIFDDYGSPDWPEVTEYVDKEIIGCDELELVGTEFRSAVFRVN